MPSTITHAYLSLDTINLLNNKPREILNKRIENFKTYSQGMDILYFYNILLLKENKVRKLGHTFHIYHTFDVIEYLINKNKINKDLELFTFICGLISHYVADRTFHPFINYYSKNTNKIKVIDKHFLIETFFDAYLIDKNETINHKKFKNYNMLFNTNENIIIKESINEIFLKFYNFSNMGDYYYKSLKNMKFVYRNIRYDNLGIKRFFYKLIDFNPFNIRRVTFLSYNFNYKAYMIYLNKNHNIWYNIKDSNFTSKKDFDDLYKDVINKNSHIINNIYDYIYNDKEINLLDVIGNYSYSTGLEIKK